MKKYIVTFIIIISAFGALAQNSDQANTLVRHDTTVLRAAECEWIIKALKKNDPSLASLTGKSISFVILDAIEYGRLKAVDKESNKPIPAKEIYQWHMPYDSTEQVDKDGNMRHVAVQRLRKADNVSKIRIYNDWFFNVTTGKFQNTIRIIELLEELHSPSGMFIGYTPLCRIYY